MADLVAVPPQSTSAAAYGGDTAGRSNGPDTTRAGISYKRDFFANLLTRSASASAESGRFNSRPPAATPTLQSSYSDKLIDLWQDVGEYARRYKQNDVKRVYDLVVSRYKFCLKTLEGIELDTRDLRQQCQATGPLADQAAQFGAPGATIWPPLDQVDGQLGRLRAPQAQQKDQCAFYRQGLEPWSEGLIRQDMLSAQLIQGAKC